MKKSHLNRCVAISFAAILLAACGGGGSGGSGTPSPVDSDGDGVFDSQDAFPNDPNETVDSDGDGIGDNSDPFPFGDTTDGDGDGVVDNDDDFPNDPISSIAYEARQNRLMPLTVGTSLDYDDGTSGVVAKGDIISSNRGVDIFRITYGTAPDHLVLLIESSPDAIRLHGIEGNFQTSGVTIEKIIFDKAAPLLIRDGSNTLHTASTTAKVTASSGVFSGELTIPVNYTKLETPTTYASPVTVSYGYDLPAVRIDLNATIVYKNSTFGIDINENFQTALTLVEGIGIVAQHGTYGSKIVDTHISSQTNLPDPIWFEYNAGEPIKVTDNTTFVTQPYNTLVNSTVYRVANGGEINALGWITIQEDSASNSFNVTMQNHANLPAVGDLPTSVEIVFEKLSDGTRMSGNITLLP